MKICNEKHLFGVGSIEHNIIYYIFIVTHKRPVAYKQLFVQCGKSMSNVDYYKKF